jgi:two-component system response regulator ResD
MAKVLLIEDYLSLQEIYRETLELDGHKVSVAVNAEEALELAKNNQFDIILLDLLLQQSLGIDFLAAFDVKKHPDTQIIIISNLFTNAVLNQALELGAKHYLMKSEITPGELATVVRETLEEASSKSSQKP